MPSCLSRAARSLGFRRVLHHRLGSIRLPGSSSSRAALCIVAGLDSIARLAPSPLRLIRGIAPGMLQRGEGHIINVATWGVFSEASPLFSVYNASKAALSAVSRVIETEWGAKGVHSTTLYYPLVATPMIAPTKQYQGLPALTSQEAAGWMITAARTRPVRIAPRMAVFSQALDTIGPGLATTMIRRQRLQPGDA